MSAEILEAAQPASGPPETSPAVVVRLAEPAEHAAVADLLERAYTADYAIGDEYRASLRAVAERAAEHQVWVAARRDPEGDVLLGSVATPRPGRTISPLARPGELDFRLLGVDPSARGQGVGRLLTRHVVDLARERGLVRVVMNSGPRMLPAHRLYASLGFERLTERETHVVEGGTLLAFGLDVAPHPTPDPTHRTES
ncbi:GNAT family N-acetyltransferase [Luteimicrobium sp. DT211]|uniref:GNAT family N-acetyltransferase n=1 Tax=Luteimicrobium sp. DT211 TaxID=3393412 RepID=UPI003CF0D431